MSDLNDLARAVQQHVLLQPWGRYGDLPIPLEVMFNGNEEDGGPRWSVRFVTGVKGDRRIWGRTAAPTLTGALELARAKQTGRSR